MKEQQKICLLQVPVSGTRHAYQRTPNHAESALSLSDAVAVCRAELAEKQRVREERAAAAAALKAGKPAAAAGVRAGGMGKVRCQQLLILSSLGNAPSGICGMVPAGICNHALQVYLGISC
jgi:hypothetical protein